jgi:hypothetical protein
MLTVHDLISEGYLALLLADGKYDPQRAARSTFVYWVVRNHFVKLSQRWPIMADLSGHLIHDPVSMLENAQEFRSAVSLLSEEAKQVVRIILNSPKELMDLAKVGVPDRLQKAVVKMLRKKGWTKEVALARISEIKSIFQKL